MASQKRIINGNAKNFATQDPSLDYINSSRCLKLMMAEDMTRRVACRKTNKDLEGERSVHNLILISRALR